MYLLYVDVKNILHVGRQLGEQRPEAEVLAAMRQQDGPERKRGQDAQPRSRHWLIQPNRCFELVLLLWHLQSFQNVAT